MLPERKVRRLERVMMASYPVWNIDSSLKDYYGGIYLKSASSDGRERLYRFTTREFEVLQRLALGLMCQDIANEFVISPQSLKNHVTRIRQELGINRKRSEPRSQENIIPKMIEEGLLNFVPRIPESSWVGMVK